MRERRGIEEESAKERRGEKERVREKQRWTKEEQEKEEDGGSKRARVGVRNRERCG